MLEPLPTFHRIKVESDPPDRIKSSFAVDDTVHTLASCASKVFRHSLVLTTHNFSMPSEPLDGLQIRRGEKKYAANYKQYF